MNLLIAQCKKEPDFDFRTMFCWDFEHDTMKQQKEEAAFFVIAVISSYKTDFYFTSVINNNHGDRPDLTDAWINHGIAALSSLKRKFTPDVWTEIIDLAIDLAKNEYCDNALADNIKEYRIFVI